MVRPWRVGIDTGGTFTDLVALGPHGPIALKVPSCPEDPSRAVVAALAELRRRYPDTPSRCLVVHGSTVATNALLEERTARVALVTNHGFEDLIEIGRQARRDLYALLPSRPSPLVARPDRVGVRERTLAGGDRKLIPEAAELQRVLQAVRRRRPEAIAICLLHSYENPRPERELSRVLRPLSVPVTASHQVAPRFREFERFSTTVANAALLPILQRYLRRLQSRLPADDLWMMQSSGGLTDVAQAARYPVQLVLSGPAGGLHAAERFARAARLPPLVTFDMGGTSTDVGLVQGEARRADQIDIGGRPLMIDAVELHTIGAGGGSLLWKDEAETLRVGPGSSGADPGPACYGKGTEATVTDAHVVLGRLPLTAELGGSIRLQPERSHRAIDRLRQHFGDRKLTRTALAEVVLSITDAAMERAIKTITLERGHDPRDFALFSFGGAGGLHACRLASRLGMREVIVPPSPGAISAYGMALSDARLDQSEAVMKDLTPALVARLRRRAQQLADRAARRLEGGLGRGKVRATAEISCRHEGQSHELRVPLRGRPDTAFLREHRRRYGFVLEDTLVECVALHVSSVRRSGMQTPAAARKRTPGPAPRTATTPLWIGSPPHAVPVPVFARDQLPPGQRLRGPALVLESTATFVVEPGFDLEVDRHHCLRVRKHAPG